MEKVYVLDVRVPKQDNQNIEVLNEIQMGSDESCDLQINDHGLAPLHGRFRLQNGVLTFTHLGPDNSFKIGRHKCGHGRMYILSSGDKCSIEKVKIIVKEEKVSPEELQNNKEEEEIEEDSPLNRPFTSEGVSDETVDDQLIDEGPTKETRVSTDPTDEHAMPLESKEAPEEQNEPQAQEEEEEFEYVEEEVYVDEEGNEVAAPKKPSFFSKLKAKFKREKKKESPVSPKKHDLGLKGKKSKKANGPVHQVAGPLARFIGLLYSLFFFYLTLHLLLPIIEENFEIKILTISGDIWNEITPHLAKLPKELPPQVKELPYTLEVYTFIQEKVLKENIFHYLFFFAVFELLFHFLLGLSLGQFLIGLKNSGRGLISRILSPIRLLLGWITLPLLIFDFPILLKKRSFKEVITFSRIINRKKRLTFLLSTLILPLIIIVAFNTPILLDLTGDLSDNFIISEGAAPKLRGKNVADRISFKSITFGIEGEAYFDNRTSLIPNIKIEGPIFYPQLIASTPKKNALLRLTYKEKVSETQELLELCRRDPLFKVIHQNIENNESELVLFFYKVLSININNIPDALKNFGPFLGPYYLAAKKLKSKLGAKDIKEVTLFNGKKGYSVQIFSKKQSGDIGLSLLKIKKGNINLLQGVAKPEHDIFARTFFLKTLLNVKSYDESFKNLMGFVRGNNMTNPLQMGLVGVDILNEVIKKKKMSPESAQIITNLLTKLSSRAIKEENENFQLTLLDVFKDLDKALLKVNKSKKNKVLSDLRLSLATIQKALNSRDPEFFKLNR